MRFCSKLCYELNFEPHALQPCCKVRSNTVPRFDYSGGPVDIKGYLGYIQNIVNGWYKGTSDMCTGCPELVDAPKEGFSVDFLFRAISINHHRYLCNCRCTYCNLWDKKQAPSYSILPGIKSLYDAQMLLPTCFFSWGGGEPSILPEFEEACFTIGDWGFIQYVHTNAMRFSPAIAAMIHAKAGGINVSLDSADAETYKKVKGCDAFDRVIDSLDKYSRCKEDDSQIHLKYIIFEDNNEITQIERFFELCLQLKISYVQCSLNFAEVNRNKLSEKTLLATAFFLHRARELNLKVSTFYITNDQLTQIEQLQFKHFKPKFAQ